MSCLDSGKAFDSANNDAMILKSAKIGIKVDLLK